MTLPISTTNMTGFLIILRGVSLASASMRARRTIFASQSERFRDVDMSEFRFFLLRRSCLRAGVGAPEWVERKRGEEGERADDENDSNEQYGEQRRVHGKGSGRRRDELLALEIAGDSEHRDDHQEASNEHRCGKLQVVPVRVRADAGEGGAVIPGGRG